MPKISKGLILQWGNITTNGTGIQVFTMPTAVTTIFTSVGTCQDWDDYAICGVTIGGRNLTTYNVLTAYLQMK